MNVQPYVFFNGNCEEAIRFYSQAIGAKLAFISYFRDMPDDAGMPVREGWQDKVMHANFVVGRSTIMAADCDESGTEHKGFQLSLDADDFAQGLSLFNALAQNGTVLMPYQATFWAEGFGMLVDRFGIPWMINVEK
ncbi:VOC family protein [Jeongeupia sp. USM3]|uniref:VOC family protein n=1 Tax=Jeongeupia sp. USM3 TaxID=1906741 RepID=UPI00089DD791|nr:VOC family protein [Jeongeupia sp. USM3]AOX99598.1 VOC family protein [Jeongeupia sp. USM3]